MGVLTYVVVANGAPGVELVDKMPSLLRDKAVWSMDVPGLSPAMLAALLSIFRGEKKVHDRILEEFTLLAGNDYSWLYRIPDELVSAVAAERDSKKLVKLATLWREKNPVLKANNVPIEQVQDYLNAISAGASQCTNSDSSVLLYICL